MDINNLTNVYNQNPTLQGQYSLQQYLDLFGQSPTTGTPPPVQIPPTDPNAPTKPVNGIINSNINQYQSGGGGGIQGLTLNAPRTARAAPINSAAFRDPLNEKIANQMRTQNPNLESRTNAEIIASNPDMFDIKTDRGFFQNTVDNIGSGIGSAYKAFKESPIGIGMSFLNPVSALASVAGMMGRKDVSEIDAAFNKSGDTYTSAGGIGNKDKYGLNKVSAFGNYAEKVGEVADTTAEAYAKAVEKYKGTKYNYMSQLQKDARVKNLKERMEYYAAEEKRRNEERQAAIAASEAAARGNYTPGGSHLSRGQSGGGLGLTESQAQSVSQANKDAGYSSFSGLAKGGMVGRRSYFNGGIVSLRRR